MYLYFFSRCPTQNKPVHTHSSSNLIAVTLNKYNLRKPAKILKKIKRIPITKMVLQS